VIIGLGYGPITPASSQISRPNRSPVADGADVLDQADRRAGRAALAGAVLPILALQLGWHAAFAAGSPAGRWSRLMQDRSCAESLDVGTLAATPADASPAFRPASRARSQDALREIVSRRSSMRHCRSAS
jgi:hypothetical protein